MQVKNPTKEKTFGTEAIRKQRKENGEADYKEFLENYINNMYEKVKKNENEEPIMIGGKAYTQSEWKKIMDGVDAQIEDVKESQKERLEKQEKESEAQRLFEKTLSQKERVFGIKRKNMEVPYGELAQNGVIDYNGVIFICDEETNSLCLGDMSDRSKVLNIPLSGGGCLKVNRDNLGDLSACVGMFSPEDLNLIMRAIALDTRIQQIKQEEEEMEEAVWAE